MIWYRMAWHGLAWHGREYGVVWCDSVAHMCTAIIGNEINKLIDTCSSLEVFAIVCADIMYSKKLIKQFSSGCFIANASFNFYFMLPLRWPLIIYILSFALLFRVAYEILLLNTTVRRSPSQQFYVKHQKPKLPVWMYWMYVCVCRFSIAFPCYSLPLFPLLDDDDVYTIVDIWHRCLALDSFILEANVSFGFFLHCILQFLFHSFYSTMQLYK